MVTKHGRLLGWNRHSTDCRFYNGILRAVEEGDTWFVVEARRIKNAIRWRPTVDLAANFPGPCIGCPMQVCERQA